MFSFIRQFILYVGIGYVITYVGTNVMGVPLPSGVSTVFIAGFAIFLWNKAMGIVRAILRMAIFALALAGFYAFLQYGMGLDLVEVFNMVSDKIPLN